MDVNMFEAVVDAVVTEEGEMDRVKAYVEGGPQICYPSSEYNIDENDNITGVANNVYEDYKLNRDEVSLMLSLEDMNKEEVIEFLSNVLENLKG